MFNPKEYPPIERNKDDSLPHMTPRQHQHAVRIIGDHCCNCDNGNCLLLDHGEEVACPQALSHSVCCMYFYHVLLQLPKAQTLNAALFHINDLKRCVRCGKPFASSGNRAKYCADCKVIVQRKQKAEYAKRRRGDSRKIDPKKASDFKASGNQN